MYHWMRTEMGHISIQNVKKAETFNLSFRVFFFEMCVFRQSENSIKKNCQKINKINLIIIIMFIIMSNFIE